MHRGRPFNGSVDLNSHLFIKGFNNVITFEYECYNSVR